MSFLIFLKIVFISDYLCVGYLSLSFSRQGTGSFLTRYTSWEVDTGKEYGSGDRVWKGIACIFCGILTQETSDFSPTPYISPLFSPQIINETL